VLRHDKAFERMRREIEALENVEQADTARRERIPDSVRLFVWQRDQGKCVKCRGAEKLEFVHIIPIAKGGSNTERNIQLMCEQCNRRRE
jgi:5-methylcytosine-specific restriction endonuclease McrA